MFKLLFKSGLSLLAQQIANPELQKKALEFVKELALRDDLTNLQKAKRFNEKMWAYAKSQGKLLGESVINCLRELAVNALKAERGQ